MKQKFIAAVMAAIVMFAFMPAAEAAAITDTTSSIYTLNDMPVYMPNGEVMYLNGRIHEIISITENDDYFRIKVQVNPMDVSGIFNGIKYQGNGGTSYMFKCQIGAACVAEGINNFLIIGQGPFNNYMVQSSYHITINADGTTTSYHDNYKAIIR